MFKQAEIRNFAVYVVILFCFLLPIDSLLLAETKDEIRVVAAEYKPFVFLEDGRLTGFDIDLLDIICRTNRLSYSVHLVSFQDALNMLREGKADIGIGAIYVTKAREKFVNFTTAYLRTGLVYVIRADDKWEDDLSNKRIGVKRLATGEMIAKKLSERFDNLSVVFFKSTEESIDALVTGKVDLVINDYLNTESLMYDKYRGKIKIKKGFAGFPELLTQDHIAMAISKQRPDLLKYFNKTLKDLKSSGMLNSILDHWPQLHAYPDFRRYIIYILISLAVIIAVFAVLLWLYRKRQIFKLWKESQEIIRAMTEYCPDAIITADSTGIIVFVNDSTTKIFGYSKDELIGRLPLTILIPEHLKEGHESGFKRFFKTGESRLIARTYETTGKRKDGSEFPVELSLSSWMFKGNVFFTVVIRDILERKEMYERLIDSERRFRSVIEGAPNPVIIQCDDESIVFINRRFTEITGYSLEEISTLESFMEHAFPNPGYRKEVLERFKAIFNLDSPVIDGVDINITCSDGSVRVWNLQSAPAGKWGDKGAVMYVARDVTDHRKLEEQLRQIQKMEVIGRFTAGIAHDFNNYISAIMGFSQLALLQLSNHPAKENIENVLKAAEKASGLTTQLLAFSRRQILRPEVVNLNDIITDMTKMIRRIIGEDIELRLVLDPLAWNVKIDVSQIEQVIMNLVSNARDAMPEGGILTIQTSNVFLDKEYASRHASVIPGEYVMMSVEDTGAGMTDEVKTRIFEPFFTTKEPGKGTGLGLATVYGIVKQSGGFIWVYSEPGEGTTFKIYLPRTLEERTIHRLERIEGLPKGKEVILVVEDNKEVREFIVRVLKELGYDVFEACDGVEALTILKDKGDRIALVLTDVIMPNLRGDKLAERVKESYPDIKILFMSGYADNIITKGGILKNGINYLSKPLTTMTLAQTVRKVLDS